MSENQPMGPSLRWAIKRTFVDYVFRMPDGRGWVTDGATVTDEDEFVYEWVGSEPTGEGGVRWMFRGNVQFAGHMGLLHVRVADPWLIVLDHRATLSVVDPFEEQGGRLDLVTVELGAAQDSEDGTVWVGEPVELTGVGVRLFNDVYAEGELFEPLMVRVPPVDAEA